MKLNGTPEGWMVAPLGELCGNREGLVGGPFGSELTTAHYQPEPGVPVIRGSNLGGDTGEFIDTGFVFVSETKALALKRNSARPGDVIFTQRGTLGQVAIVPAKPRFPLYVISQSQMRMTPDRDRIEPRFLWHYFRSPRAQAAISSRTLATGVPHINLGILRDFRVEFPSLPEQRRIAEILDKADALRAKRRAALAQFDVLGQAVFLDMFGDPVTNPKGWPPVTAGDLADVQGGLQVTATRRNLPVELPYLRVANVYRGLLDLSEIKSIRATASEVARTRLAKNDLLIVEGHGNADEIGRSALWDGSIEECTHQNHLIRVRFDVLRILPIYACTFLNSSGGRRHLLRAGRTTSGLNTISVADVRRTPILLPPMEVQSRFADRLPKIESVRAHHRNALSALDALFASLQHRAFCGGL